MEMPNWIDQRYRVISRLGKGGSSAIFQAIDQLDPKERPVAIKVLSNVPAQGRELIREMFEREVRALLRLSHPNIVQILEFGVDDANDFFYIVLEYVERSETLRERAPKWKPESSDCVELMIELLDAMTYAHQLNVIHRDLNPNNVLIDQDGRLKIIDFGISKILGDLAAQQTLGELYTRAYASPEQRMQKAIGPESDIYSLAALFYYLLTLRDPTSETSLSEQFASLPSSGYRGISDELLAVMKRMSAESPKERYLSTLQAKSAFERVRRNLQVQTQKLYLQLTRNAVQQLAEQLAIDRPDGGEAKEYVAKMLDEDVFLLRDTTAREGKYYLLGDGVSLYCAIDSDRNGHNDMFFTVIGLKADISPHEFERRKQGGFQVNAQWRVGVPGDRIPTDCMSLSGLLDEVDNYFHFKAVGLKQREKRLDLVESWQNLLYLDREIQTEEVGQVRYSSWDAVQNRTVIRATISGGAVDRDVEVFEPGQLLLMPSKGRGNIPVGHYLKQDGSTILISKLPDLVLERLASAGILIVDERQWAAAWNRQRLALDTLVDGRSQNPKLPEILLDPKKASHYRPEPRERTFIQDLDEPKRDAVTSALSAQELYLIQGPPGTGKTVLIAEIMAQILSRDSDVKVLLVSQSNVAVDHVLSALTQLLHEAGIEREIARIGREEKVASDAQVHLVNSKLQAWTDDIKHRCREYLEKNFPKEEKLDALAVEIEVIERIIDLLEAPDENSTEIAEWIELLRYQFPDVDLEANAENLATLKANILNSNSEPQTKLECILGEWLRRVGKADDFEETYLQSCSVIAGTCVGIAGVKHLPDGYDWVIIDEAGRATPAELLIPLVRGRRSILVGDHRQLPPVIEYNLHRRAQKRDDIDPTWLEQSLFEYLFVRLPNELKSTLRTQYRMHPAIANLISDVFYREEGLETGIQQEERTHQWKRWDTAVVWFSTSAIEKRFESVDQNSSKLNQCEAELITSQLADLEDTLREAGAKKKVGVIAGYSAQIQLLERKLDPSDSDRWQAVEIEVNTVDAFQGRERDIIFYSVVRSNRKHEIGFLKDARRLNVALSRARDMLFVVGDHRMLAEANVPIGGNPFVDVLKHILSHPAECTLKEASL